MASFWMHAFFHLQTTGPSWQWEKSHMQTVCNQTDYLLCAVPTFLTEVSTQLRFREMVHHEPVD